MTFADRMAGLTAERRLHFYEVLAHNLTVEVRDTWAGDALPDAEKVDRMKTTGSCWPTAGGTAPTSGAAGRWTWCLAGNNQ